MPDPRNSRPVEHRLRDFLKAVSGGARPPDLASRTLELSWELESGGQAEQAFRLLKGMLAFSPRESSLRFEMMKLLERTGRDEEAVTVFLEDCAQAPVEQRLHAATLLISKGRLTEAESILSREPKLPESNPLVQRAWGRVMRWQHRFARAAAAYGRAIDAAPLDPEPYLLRAECYLGLGDLDRMFLALKDGLGNCPQPGSRDVKGWLWRYRLNLCALDFARASRIGEKVLDLTRETEDLEWLQWQIFTEDGDFLHRPERYRAQSQLAAEGLLRARPDSPWGRYFKLMLRESSPSRPSRLMGLEELSKFPAERYGWMRFKAGLLLLHDQMFRPAAREFAVAARAAKPGNWKAQALACDCLIHAGRKNEAAAAMKCLPRLAPERQLDFGEFWAQQGKLLLWLGRYGEALAALENASRHTSYQALGWKGAALVKLERFSEALECLDRAVGLPAFLGREEAHLWRAEALYRLGRTPEALEDCRRAQAPDPWNSIPHLWILKGLLHWEAGDASALRADARFLPAELIELARAATGIRGSEPALLADLFRALLDMAGGIRVSPPVNRHHWKTPQERGKAPLP